MLNATNPKMTSSNASTLANTGRLTEVSERIMAMLRVRQGVAEITARGDSPGSSSALMVMVWPGCRRKLP